MALIRITDQTIKNSWTIFIIILSLLVITLVRVWITVGVWPNYDAVYVDGDLNPPRVITKVEPVYPEQAKKAGITGEILLEVYTDHDGNVIRTIVLDVVPFTKDNYGIWSLYIAAREAVSQWIFEPFIFNDQVRDAIFTVAINFE